MWQWFAAQGLVSTPEIALLRISEVEELPNTTFR